MKILKNIIVTTFLLSFAGASHATAIMLDFKADANINERGYTELTNYAGLTITGSGPDDDSQQYAYMDSRSGSSVANGGLGVCRDVNSSNQCTPSSDDNVTVGETVHMKWSSNIIITGIWFNNNHDGNWSLEDNTISIGADDYFFDADDFDATRSSGDGTLANAVSLRNADFFYGTRTAVSANSSFDISYFNDQFYISAIRYETVPEPGILALLSIGLIGLGVLRHRK